MNKLEHAIETLRKNGHDVERCEFPPLPLPGLYMVDGREFTERQIIGYAVNVLPKIAAER